MHCAQALSVRVGQRCRRACLCGCVGGGHPEARRGALPLPRPAITHIPTGGWTKYLTTYATTQPPCRSTPLPLPAQGVYVLQDNGFRWLQRLAPAGPAGSDPSKDEAVKRLAASYLHMPCGIIRGALSRLGLPCTVEADPKGMPSCEPRCCCCCCVCVRARARACACGGDGQPAWNSGCIARLACACRQPGAP